MLYTSYFGAMKNFPENYIPVSICGRAPKSYHGVEYKKLAPKKDFFMEWKKNNDNEFYIKNFNEKVIGTLDQYAVIEEIINFLPADAQNKIKSSQLPVWRNSHLHIVMVCYEKPGDFCHRHIVADWFFRAKIPCMEILF